MFNANGSIDLKPFATEKEKTEDGSFVIINFYKIGEEKITYSLQAKIQKRIYAKYPHPEDRLFSNKVDARLDADEHLKNFCFANKLKKQYFRLRQIAQPSLFDDLI